MRKARPLTRGRALCLSPAQSVRTRQSGAPDPPAPGGERSPASRGGRGKKRCLTGLFMDVVQNGPKTPRFNGRLQATGGEIAARSADSQPTADPPCSTDRRGSHPRTLGVEAYSLNGCLEQFISNISTYSRYFSTYLLPRQWPSRGWGVLFKWTRNPHLICLVFFFTGNGV